MRYNSPEEKVTKRIRNWGVGLFATGVIAFFVAIGLDIVGQQNEMDAKLAKLETGVSDGMFLRGVEDSFDIAYREDMKKVAKNLSEKSEKQRTAALWTLYSSLFLMGTGGTGLFIAHQRKKNGM
ncbi:MAG: hypothetical protein FWE50_01245 [Alphaproteobacteria bacterium]|nr:hypothetical protein [Alphaproteobacteria bacterium]